MPFRFGGDAVHVYLTINNIVWQEDADHPSYYEAYDLARRAFARLRRFEREDAEPPVRAVRRDGKENP